jgi:hypothetical protein
MKPEEVSTNKYLKNHFGGNVVFEPDGNVPPDFAVNSIYAVEVRRLNQQFFNEQKTEGLENLSFPLYYVLKEVLRSFNTLYSGKSYLVDMDYRRPLDKNMRQIKSEMHNSLETFLQTEVSLPCMLKVNEKIDFWINSSDAINGQVFQFVGEHDEDAGGGVISVYIENIRHCISAKSSKIKQYKSKYEAWWLYLVDYLELGLDHGEVEKVKSVISDLGEFNKVAVIHYTGELLFFEISPK